MVMIMKWIIQIIIEKIENKNKIIKKMKII